MPEKRKTFSECNEGATRQILTFIVALFDSVKDKIPFLQREATKASMVLPNQYDDEIMKYICDMKILHQMERKRVINWCPSIRYLTPLSVEDDGNSMAHAVSLYIFGVQDRGHHFRQLIYQMMFMLQNQKQGDLFIRWNADRNEILGLILSSKSAYYDLEKNKNWEYYLHHCSRQKDHNGRYLPLEALHIFVLANVLGRPIIVLINSRGNTDEEIMQSIRLEGVYLPLLRDPQDCEKSPVVIGYEDNRFLSLLSTEKMNLTIWGTKAADHAQHCVPLLKSDFSGLPVRFLKQYDLNNKQLKLQTYFDLVQIPFNGGGNSNIREIGAVILKFKAPHAQSIELLWSMLDVAAQFAEEDRKVRALNPPPQIPCVRQKAGMCNNFASERNDQTMCDECYTKYLRISQNVKRRSVKPKQPVQQTPQQSPVQPEQPPQQPFQPPPHQQPFNQPSSPIMRQAPPEAAYDHLGNCTKCRKEKGYSHFDSMCKPCYNESIVEKFKVNLKPNDYESMGAILRSSQEVIKKPAPESTCNQCESKFPGVNEFGLCNECHQKIKRKQEDEERKRNSFEAKQPPTTAAAAGNAQYAGAAGGASGGGAPTMDFDRKKVLCSVAGCMDRISMYSNNLCQKHYDAREKKEPCTICEKNTADDNEYGVCIICLKTQSNILNEVKNEEKKNVNVGRGPVNHNPPPINAPLDDFLFSLPPVPNPDVKLQYAIPGRQEPSFPANGFQANPPPHQPQHQRFHAPSLYEGFTNAEQKVNYGGQEGAMNWQREQVGSNYPKCSYCDQQARPGGFGLCEACERIKNGGGMNIREDHYQVPRQPMQPMQPRKCGNIDKANCPNPVYDDAEFMCRECIEEQRVGLQKVGGHQQQQQPQQQQGFQAHQYPPQNQQNQFPCLTRGCLQYAERPDQLCQTCQQGQYPNFPPIPQPASFPQQQQQQQQQPLGGNREVCKALDCDFFGNPEFGGYCSSCFLEVTKQEAKKQQAAVRTYTPEHSNGNFVEIRGRGPVNTAPVLGENLQAFNQPPQMGYGNPPPAAGYQGQVQVGFGIQPMNCRNPECDMFGRPEWNGLCSKCFKANRVERDASF